MILVAREMAMRVKPVVERVPRGYRNWADQLLRAAGNTVGLIGEGANRFSPGRSGSPGVRGVPAEGAPKRGARRVRWPAG